MQTTKYTALITGATGLIGQELVKQLLMDDRCERVTVWVRKRTELQHPKLEQVVVTFDALPQEGNGLGASLAFCCLGTTIKKAGSQAEQYKIDHDYVVAFAQTCARNGIRSLAVVSSLGADRSTSNFYLRTKGEMERDVSALPFHQVVFVRPSLLLGKRSEFRFGEAIMMRIMRATGWLMVGGLKRYKAIEAKQVAEGLIRESLANQEGVRIVESDKI